MRYMKVLLGWIDQEHGTVETTSAGLVYGGPDLDHVRELVERQRVWYDRAGVRHMLTDDELVRSLAYRLQGRLPGPPSGIALPASRWISRQRTPGAPFGGLRKTC